jgi:hypothetical protein
MSKEEWSGIYRAAWDAYYTRDHLWTIMRRAAATGMGLSRLTSVLFFFSSCVQVENVHPLQGGVFRLKYRRDRRPGLPIEPVWSFYPKLALEIVTKHLRIGRQWLLIDGMARKLRRDPDRTRYMDQALTPVTDDETESLELFTHNAGAREAVEHSKKIAELTGGAAA